VNFVNTFNKDYKTDKKEFMNRFDIFNANYDLIEKHNAAGKSWTMAANQFADLTHDEFVAKYVGTKAQRVKSNLPSFSAATTDDIPDSVDWRTKGAVTPVKDQGQCGSCWSFSTTGAVEGAHFVATGELKSLSEQQLVDCAYSEGNMGCEGGLMDEAFQYLIDNKGLCLEADYPYEAVDSNCRSTQCTNAVTITGFVDVKVDSEEALQKAVAVQPVSVAIEADQPGFQFYHGGVFDGQCGTQLDHGVLAVGYGTSSTGEKYWVVKNSWGGSWGEQGYIRLLRKVGTTTGQCGIDMAASYPIAAKTSTPQINLADF